MTFDQIKKLATSWLRNYEVAWKENAALRAMLATVPMVDGTKGIPNWEDILASHLANEKANALVRSRFAPLYAQIESAQQDSDLLELLRTVPPAGGIQ